MAFMSREEIEKMGFGHVGKGVQLSDKASYYNTANISIGDYVRIDDFCILSAGEGGISLGDHVHIGCFSSLIGQGKITFEDFSGVSPRNSVFSSTDDFTGRHMSSPTIPNKYRGVTTGPVTLRKHAAVAASCLILPNVEMGFNSGLGAMSLLKDSTEPNYMYFGRPAKKLIKRKTHIVELEKEFLAEKEQMEREEQED